MTTLIPIHSAAMCQVDQVRCAIVVGARSLFHSGECDTSSCSSTKSRRSADPSSVAAVVMSKCGTRIDTNSHESSRMKTKAGLNHRGHRGRRGVDTQSENLLCAFLRDPC